MTRKQEKFLTRRMTFSGQHIIWVGTLFSPTVHESLANIAAKFRTTVCLRAVLPTSILSSISLSDKPLHHVNGFLCVPAHSLTHHVLMFVKSFSRRCSLETANDAISRCSRK